MGWRDHLGIHPACELLPPLPQNELRALGEDIKKNRLQERAKVIRQGDKFVLLDGRCRLEAIEAAGLTIKVFDGSSLNNKFFEMVEEIGDPFDYVVSMNIRRRHLTAEQKRDVVAKLLKVKPERSDRQISKQVGVSPTTVGDVRRKSETSGDVSKLDTRTDARGRRQPARKSKPERGSSAKGVIPPIDEASLPARPAPQEFNDEADAKDQEFDLERELNLARGRIIDLENQVDERDAQFVRQADEIRALQAALNEKTASVVTPGVAPRKFTTGETLTDITWAIAALVRSIADTTPAEVVAGSDPTALIRLARDAELGSAWLGALHALAKSAAKTTGDCQDGEVS